MTKASGSAKSEPARRAPFRFSGGVLTLTLRVQPGAAETAPAGRYGDSALRLRLAEPAREGRANRACIRFFSKALGVPAAAVTLLHGQGSRDKVIRIAPVSERQAKALLKRWES